MAALVLGPLGHAQEGVAVHPDFWEGHVDGNNAAQTVANGVWADAGGFRLSWVISQTGSTYTYSYTFTVPQGLVNHWILQVDPDFDFDNHSGTPAGALTTWGISPSNPGIPGEIFGIKWDGTPGDVSFTSDSPPMWGSFYAKDGEAGGKGTNYAYNAGFGTEPAESATSFDAWIPVPMGVLPCDNIPNCIYVANHAGGQIIAVDRDTGGMTMISDLTEIIPGALPEDVTVGPDDRVYACLPQNGAIVRVNRDGSNRQIVYESGTVQPQGVRFNAAGDLVFTDKNGPASGTGVWRIPGAAFVDTLPMPAAQSIAPGALVGGSIGQGLAFLHNGDLLIVDQAHSRVMRSPHPGYASSSMLIQNLDSPTGIAVDRRNHIMVANGGGTNAIRRFSSSGLPLPSSGGGHYAEFEVDGIFQTPNYLEVIADNTMFVATADADAANGRVFRVEPGANADDPPTVIQLAKLRKAGGASPAASGLGVGGTSMSLTKTFSTAENVQAFNFGPFQAEFVSDITGSCDLTVTATQHVRHPYNQLLADFSLHASMIPFLGEQGFVVTFEASKPACFGTETGIHIAGFYEPGNPRIARFSFEPPPTEVDILTLLGFYPTVITSTGEFGDPETRGGTINWSEFALVDQATVVNGVVGASGHFCGFSNPLGNTSNHLDARTFNSGQNVTIKFRIGEDASCRKNFITTSINLLSVARVYLPDGTTQVFEPMTVEPSGSSVPDPPIFKFGEGQYNYTLNTTGYPPGYYEIIVNSDAMPFVTTWIQLR